MKDLSENRLELDETEKPITDLDIIDDELDLEEKPESLYSHIIQCILYAYKNDQIDDSIAKDAIETLSDPEIYRKLYLGNNQKEDVESLGGWEYGLNIPVTDFFSNLSLAEIEYNSGY